MSENRSGKAASSLLFKLMESFGMQGIAFVVSLLLARPLLHLLQTPDEIMEGAAILTARFKNPAELSFLIRCKDSNPTSATLLSVYDLVNANQLVIDKAALATIEEVFA